jgi:hypothetical protein
VIGMFGHDMGKVRQLLRNRAVVSWLGIIGLHLLKSSLMQRGEIIKPLATSTTVDG